MEDLRALRDDPRVIAEARKKGITVEELIEDRASMLQDDDVMDMIERCPQNVIAERMAFKKLRVLVPPPHANEPAEVETSFKKIRASDFSGRLDLDGLHQLVRKRWSPNYTMLDENW